MLFESINKAAGRLTTAGIPGARFDAEVLLRHTLGRDRAWLLAHMQEAVDDELLGNFERAVERRAQREPLQYITGKQEFWGLDFAVTRDVLVPRPETELIIETALDRIPKKNEPLTIIDLCTGSGCIGVCLAKELPFARIFAADKSAKALKVAGENACKHVVADRIQFFEGDLFDPLDALDMHGQVDLIVSNPPYVPSGEFSALQAEVRDYEPEMALIAGPRGTEIHQRILDEAPRFLKGNGALIMEMGIGQAATLVRMIQETGAFTGPDVLKDLAGIDRIVTVRKK